MCKLPKYLFWLAILSCWPSMLLAAQSVQLNEQGCRLLAIWSRDIVWTRDMGANKENVRRWVEENEKDNPYFTIILWRFNGLWETKEIPQTIAERTWGECAGKQGSYEEPV